MYHLVSLGVSDVVVNVAIAQFGLKSAAAVALLS
jgi:hypothetical protein